MSNTALNAALFTTLAGTLTNAGSSVYYLQAPDAAALPYIVFDYTADLDENLDRNRTKVSIVSVRAYASTPGAAGTIDNQVDTLLHLQSLTVTGYTNFWTARESAYAAVENDKAGRKTYMSGADYRVRLDLS